MDKLLVTIKSTSAETKAPNGSFEAILSVPTLDRDNEIIDAGAFNPLPAKITIDIDHAMSVEKTVGSGQPFYDGEVLKIRGTYASHPLAQMVRGLVDEEHIDSMSVAFMNGLYEVDKKDGKRHLRKGELLNAGIVGIPSNRDALITASKSLVADVIGRDVTLVPGLMTVDEVRALEGLDTTAKSGARNSASDLKLLQTAHDALQALGAECETKSPSTDDETPTDTDAKAATAAAPQAPAVPAPVNVNVATATATLAEAELALLDTAL